MGRGDHALEGAAARGGGPVPPGADPGTLTGDSPGGRELSPARVAGRAAVARVLAGLFAAAHARGTNLVARWMRTLGVSRARVRQWCDPTHPHAAVAVGDLWALADADLDEVLAALCVAREATRPAARAARDPQGTVLGLVVRVGELARTAALAMADGVCTPAEWTDLEARLADLERAARAARVAALQAAAAPTT
jgi:hypothetical protein